MATSRGVEIADLDNEFRHETRRYRGHVYVIKELPMVDYQKAVKQATSQVADADTGTEIDKFDADLHTAIMLGKCVTIDGKKTTADALYEKGTALVRQLQRDVSGLHFDEEKSEDLEEDEAPPGEAPAS